MAGSDLAALPNLRQGPGTVNKAVVATDAPLSQFSCARAAGVIQMLPPECELSVQPVQIEIGKGAVRDADITHGTLQNRARTHMVALGLVMKSDRQLNHTLEVPAQGAMTRRLTPDVFEDLVGVEKTSSIEQRYAVLQFMHRHLVEFLRGTPGTANMISHSYVVHNNSENCIYSL